MTNALSPVIRPTKYERPDKKTENVIEVVSYGNWNINTDNIDNSKLATLTADDMVMYYSRDGSVYITEEGCHVGEVLYRSNPTVFLREKCLSALVELEDADIVSGIEVVNKRKIHGVKDK